MRNDATNPRGQSSTLRIQGVEETIDQSLQTRAALPEVISVQNLTIDYSSRSSLVTAVDSLSFDLLAATTLCLVGESGSGKSSTAMAIPRLLPRTARVSGEILFRGRSVAAMRSQELLEFRRRDVSLILQDATGSLVPNVRIGTHLTRVVAHRLGLSRSRDAVPIAEDLMCAVGLTDLPRIWNAYPAELSGGMCQRAMIALALSTTPSLVIADEPISALDAISQASILRLLLSLQKRYRFAMLYVTHDLRVAAKFERVGVLQRGRLVELRPAGDLIDRPENEYTRQLIAAARELSGDFETEK